MLGVHGTRRVAVALYGHFMFSLKEVVGVGDDVTVEKEITFRFIVKLR